MHHPTLAVQHKLAKFAMPPSQNPAIHHIPRMFIAERSIRAGPASCYGPHTPGSVQPAWDLNLAALHRRKLVCVRSASARCCSRQLFVQQLPCMPSTAPEEEAAAARWRRPPGAAWRRPRGCCRQPHGDACRFSTPCCHHRPAWRHSACAAAPFQRRRPSGPATCVRSARAARPQLPEGAAPAPTTSPSRRRCTTSTLVSALPAAGHRLCASRQRCTQPHA